jgi:hypothetical protein
MLRVERSKNKGEHTEVEALRLKPKWCSTSRSSRWFYYDSQSNPPKCHVSYTRCRHNLRSDNDWNRSETHRFKHEKSIHI